MTLRTIFLTAFSLAISGLCGPNLKANTLDFSYQIGDTNFGIFASGVLTTSDTAVNGAYDITNITGSRTIVIGGNPTTQAITGLLNPDTAYSAGNLLYAASPYLDDSGFTYTLAGGYGGDDFAGDVNVSYFNNAYYEPIEGFGSGTFTLTQASAAPEPSSFGLLAGGALAALGLCRRFRLRRSVMS